MVMSRLKSVKHSSKWLKIQIKYMSNYHEFDFQIMKKLVCKYAQTLDYKEGWKKVKLDYLEEFDEHIPYPIQEFLEDYTILINWLEQSCEDSELLELKYITQTELFGLGWSPRLLKVFELEPDITKRRDGGYGYYNLYNYNKIVAIMETEEFQLEIAKKKSKKLNYL